MTLEELKKKKVSAISLGCDKNRVDLEKMLYNLKNFGFTITENIAECNILIVNTCAFITPAVKESIDNILLAISQKTYECEKVIVTGCLNNRFPDQVKDLFKDVDCILNIKDNDQIVNKVLELYDVEAKYTYKNGRLLTNMPHYAYLKIADGCDNGCAYCTIPRIRGRYKSEPMDMLIKEAKDLAEQGVKEIILVAQDITRYGIDLYNKYCLIDLIRELSKIKKIQWIRLHYCYPEMVDDALLQEIKNNPKACKYIDIPLQHIDDKILKDMNRRSTEEQVRNLIDNIKTNYPEIAIRSTFIIGFPGETRKQFKKLIEFLESAKLNNVGFFPFYKEEKTKAYFMKKQVPNFIKKLRLKKAEKIQEKVMNANNINLIGQETDVIIDYFDDDSNVFVGRTNQNSPDVDFYIIFDDSDKIKAGEIYKAKITEYMNGIFKGEILS